MRAVTLMHDNFTLNAESEELELVPPTAVCSAAGVTLLWTAYGLHRVSFSGNTMLMTKVALSDICSHASHTLF